MPADHERLAEIALSIPQRASMGTKVRSAPRKVHTFLTMMMNNVALYDTGHRISDIERAVYLSWATSLRLDGALNVVHARLSCGFVVSCPRFGPQHSFCFDYAPITSAEKTCPVDG